MEPYEFVDKRNRFIFRHGRIAQPIKDMIPLHIHNSFELLYIVSADATYGVEDRRYKLKKDDLIIIRPNIYHYIQIDSPQEYERYNILFDAALLGNIDFLPEELDVVNCRHIPYLGELFQKMEYYYEMLGGDSFGELLPLLLQELVYNLSISGTGSKKNQYATVHPIVSGALRQINEGLFQPIKISEIAEAQYVTESYLHRLFQQELKTTPKKYIAEKRLLAAQMLLLQGMKPTKVYQECGFLDYSAFYRSYCRYFGYPPSQEGSCL